MTDDDSNLCKRCNQQTLLRDGCEPSDLCDLCAQAVLPVLIEALEQISSYPVDPESVAYAMQDIADKALKVLNNDK